MALLTLCARLPSGCVAVSGIQYRTGGESGASDCTEKCVVFEGVGIKTVCFAPEDK